MFSLRSLLLVAVLFTAACNRSAPANVAAMVDGRAITYADLEKRFPESRRKAYYLMAIHENLTRIPKKQLREVGWSKAAEMTKVARKD